MLKAFDDWTAASIDKRHELLTGLAGEIWTTRSQASPTAAGG